MQFVCLTFERVGVPGVREDKTSYSFSLALTLSFLWHGEWKCWKRFLAEVTTFVQ